MQAPVPHDYGGVEWRSLIGPTLQPFVVVAGYTTVIENDPETTPGQLIERVAELPEDTQDATLDEIHVRVRPVEGMTPDPGTALEIWTGVTVDPETGGYSLEGATLAAEIPVSTLEWDDDAAVVPDPPQAEPGSVMVIRLVPGSSAPGSWEFAITPNRAPYGGWAASVESDELSGALAFQTIFDQPTDTSGLAGHAFDRLSDGFIGDPLLLIVYGVLACLAAGGLFVALWRPGKGT